MEGRLIILTILVISSCTCLSTAAEIGFEQLRYYCPESSSQQVCLVVTGGSILSTVNLVVNSREAVADESDYTFRRLYVELRPGTARRCFLINIVDDQAVEGNETFTLSLAELAGGLPRGVSINTNNNGTVIHILDNDVFLNCMSFLRFVRPELFSHCNGPTCTYSSFSRWRAVPGSTIPAPLGICGSGLAQLQFRSQTAQGCPTKTERRLRCVLTDDERLIHSFKLGIPPQGGNVNPGPNSLSVQLNSVDLGPSGPSTAPPQRQCSSSNVCQNLNSNNRFCAQRRECEPVHDNQCSFRTVVLVLDTSGSIGSANFNRMKNALSRFIPLFCDNMQVAVVSYSHNINVEFCFNCHNLSQQHPDRSRVVSSIQGMTYRGGYTHTGRATRCVSDYVLNPANGCGVNISADCLDIIYVTDGDSNGPLRYPQSCEEVTCLKNHPDWCGRVNTYAIAIGNNVNRDEIDCLTNNNEDSVFNVNDFAQLKELVDRAERRMLENSSKYICVEQSDVDILL